ncbi:NAD-dependent epimerase/dehydratase family protein [Chloroflexota bacterium]
MAQNPDELKGKKILVTGGAGFVGSHIVDRLSPDNDVTVLDNMFTGSMTNLSKSKDRITFVKGDILDKELVNKLAADAEYIFHLAAHVGNIRSLEDPYFDMNVNIGGMLNLLEACRDTGVKRIVYSASAASFGEARYLPIDENHPQYPESPYAASKLAAEKYAFTYYKVYNVPTAAVRYFNIYGPRQDTSEYANAVSIFLGKFKRKQPITIYGDGEQTRDFLFIQDVVNANILAATHPKALGQNFNIATGKATSINTVADIIDSISGYKNERIYAPSRAGEVMHSRATIEKAQKTLGFNPTTTLEEGLRSTWQELTKESK